MPSLFLKLETQFKAYALNHIVASFSGGLLFRTKCMPEFVPPTGNANALNHIVAPFVRRPINCQDEMHAWNLSAAISALRNLPVALRPLIPVSRSPQQ